MKFVIKTTGNVNKRKEPAAASKPPAARESVVNGAKKREEKTKPANSKKKPRNSLNASSSIGVTKPGKSTKKRSTSLDDPSSKKRQNCPNIHVNRHASKTGLTARLTTFGIERNGASYNPCNDSKQSVAALLLAEEGNDS